MKVLMPITLLITQNNLLLLTHEPSSVVCGLIEFIAETRNFKPESLNPKP